MRRLLPGARTGQGGDDPVRQLEAGRVAVPDDPEQGSLWQPDHQLDCDHAVAPVAVLDDRRDQLGGDARTRRRD
jgi:hypothetical protein